MVLVTSTMMMGLKTKAPEFALDDVVSGQIISLETFAQAKGLLVMFICVHCPYVKHVQQELARIGQDYVPQGLGVVAISSNHTPENAWRYAADDPEHLKQMAEALGFNFPYCYDPTQEVAKAYTAACTPDFFLFDGQRQLVYRGQLDNSRPTNGLPVTGQDLRLAIDAVLSGGEVNPEQRPSFGCNIKWDEGREPIYWWDK
jgi:peroxiredoxin